jgi:hypothetical protein
MIPQIEVKFNTQFQQAVRISDGIPTLFFGPRQMCPLGDNRCVLWDKGKKASNWVLALS